MRIAGLILLVFTLVALPPALDLPGLASLAAEQPPPKPAPQDEYVPIDQLPPEEELPAAPMVVAAYTFIWIAFLVYMFSLVRRVRAVEADLKTLERERR